jgi:protein-L-isoaspartate(D-aspartate) O-methyltransferase
MNKKQELLQSLKEKGIDSKVLGAMAKINREDFISAELEKMAYEDIPLPIGKNQTISQPYTTALMLSLLELKKGQKVLELGSGSGYVLALISEIVGEKGKVFGVEVIPELVKKSKKALSDFKNIRVYVRNGSNGLIEQAPFDRIIISASSHEISEKIISQLKNNGILVAPKGSRFEQEIVVLQRKDNVFEFKKRIPGFLFVPFIEENQSEQ